MTTATTITLDIIGSMAEIENDINAALAVAVNDELRKAQVPLLNGARSLIEGWVHQQPEVQSLLSQTPGSLAGLFGLPVGTAPAAASAIITAITNSIMITFTPFNKKLQGGGLEIKFQPNDFSNILSLQIGKITIPGGELPWLDWLLTRGDTIVVVNYQYSPQTGSGRSKLGTMEKGGSFRVPPEFSGTNTNNFITRALIGPTQERELTKLFNDVLR